MKETIESSGLLTVKDAARILKISPYTLRKWIRAMEVHPVRFGRKIIRIEREALTRWIQKNRS